MVYEALAGVMRGRGRHGDRAPLGGRAGHLALSAAVAAAASGSVASLGARGGRPAGVEIGGDPLSFPVLRIALFMAVATAALPYLARGVQRLIETFIVLVALVTGGGRPRAAGQRRGQPGRRLGRHGGDPLVFGSPLGLPSIDEVGLLLRELGISAASCDWRPGRSGGWLSTGRPRRPRTGGAGRQLSIDVYGRDAADAKLLTKAGRFVFYRDSGPTFTLTRLQQVEHEAYLMLRAGRAGVDVPELVEAEVAGPAKDALIVCRLPGGPALADAADTDGGDAALDDLYRQLLGLRRARITHGALSGDTLRADRAAGTIVLTGFRSASSNASDEQLDRDIAGAMAATAVLVGAERAADAAARSLPQPVMRSALRQLHRPALDRALRRSVAGHPELLSDLRQRAAEAAQVELPTLAEPRRVSWPTLLMVIGTLIGGWALIGVLLDVSRSFDTVAGADWLWVIVALLLAQLAYVSSAVESVGSVTEPLPFGRVLGVEVGNAFSALAGGTAAVFATRVRFLQQQGYPASMALSSGAIMTAVSSATTVLLLVICLPFAWGSITWTRHRR